MVSRNLYRQYHQKVETWELVTYRAHFCGVYLAFGRRPHNYNFEFLEVNSQGYVNTVYDGGFGLIPPECVHFFVLFSGANRDKTAVGHGVVLYGNFAHTFEIEVSEEGLSFNAAEWTFGAVLSALLDDPETWVSPADLLSAKQIDFAAEVEKDFVVRFGQGMCGAHKWK